jgi:hypothetical protein
MQIAIAILTTRQQITADIGVFCYQAGLRMGFEVLVINGVSGVAAARNTAVGQFLNETDADKLWFVDEDMVPPHEPFGLLDVPGDIVAPWMPCLKKNWDGEHEIVPAVVDYEDLGNFDTMHRPELTGDPQEVSAVGMAFTLISRHVLEDPRMRAPARYVRGDGVTCHLPDNAPPPVFQQPVCPNGHATMGEDYDFCVRAGRLGYKTVIAPSFRCGHLKNVDVVEMG